MMMARQFRHVAHRDAQLRIGEAGGIGEGRMLQADLAGALGQRIAERRLVAGERFGDRDAGVVCGIDDDALDQVRHFDPAVDRRKHGRAVRWRAALAPGVFADDVFVVELDPALFDLVEQIFERHQLGEACRLDRLIAVLFEQYAVAVGIEQDGGRNAGLKPFFLLRRGGRGGGRGLRCGDGARHACGDERAEAAPCPAMWQTRYANPPPPRWSLLSPKQHGQNRARRRDPVQRITIAGSQINRARGR